MPLIKDNDIVTLRKYVKMSFTTTSVNSMPDLDGAEREYLIPILGDEVYAELDDQVQTNTVTWGSLLNLCRAAIAPLAVYSDLPFMQASIEDGGIRTTATDHKQPVHQWEYKNIQQALLDKGSKALDQLIQHLLEKGDDYGWDNADTKASYFRTGADFNKYAPIYQPNVTFQQLKPLIAEVEDHFIRAAIGDAFFEELRDKANPGKEEKYVYVLIKKAIANYTILRAVERLPVKITSYGLLATIENTSRESMPVTPAGSEQLNILMQSAQREGDSYHIQFMQFLNATAAASDTVFTTFKNSTYYKPPVVKPDICHTTFPRHHDGHHDHHHGRRRGTFDMF